MLIGYASSSLKKSLDIQTETLRNAGCEKIFADLGTTQTTPHKHSLNHVLNNLVEGDLLVVYKLNRLAKSLPNLIKIIQMLEAKNIHIKSIHEAIDSKSSSGKLCFNILKQLEKFDKVLLEERKLCLKHKYTMQ